MFHDSKEYLWTCNGFMLFGGSEIGGSTLGECHSSIIVDTISMTQSLHNAEVSITQVPSWPWIMACMAPSWAFQYWAS